MQVRTGVIKINELAHRRHRGVRFDLLTTPGYSGHSPGYFCFFQQSLSISEGSVRSALSTQML